LIHTFAHAGHTRKKCSRYLSGAFAGTSRKSSYDFRTNTKRGVGSVRTYIGGYKTVLFVVWRVNHQDSRVVVDSPRGMVCNRSAHLLRVCWMSDDIIEKILARETVRARWPETQAIRIVLFHGPGSRADGGQREVWETLGPQIKTRSVRAHSFFFFSAHRAT